MATIGELVDRFAADERYSDRDHEIAQKWVRATRAGGYDVRVMAGPKASLTAAERRKRDEIRKKTVRFVRSHFDDRPDVVLSLDRLFAELGLSYKVRKREFLRFESLYDRDELAVLLLKHLQPVPGRERYPREDVADYFFASPRSINDHIRALLPSADSLLAARVFGQEVRMSTARTTNVPESTTHPLFLPLSMVELYTLVDLLARHVDDPVEGRIIKSVLGRVMEQTTGYAMERLSRIEGLSAALSSTGPWDDGQDVGEDVMFKEKEQIKATVRYAKDGEEKACSGLIARDRTDKAIVNVTDRGKVTPIPYRDIIDLDPRRE